MKPIVLIHGYSAESRETTREAIVSIYGDLPTALRRRYGSRNVVEIDLGRYISLEDGLSLDDTCRALDRVLRNDYAHLRRSGFHCLVHSTGALVIRNWLRRFSPKPSPLQNLVYLAGANFGSGWAHVGQGQVAKWGRMVFQGQERGIRILEALELGADWTIDLHQFFLDPANSMPDKYGVFEHVLIGSQADVQWFAAPIRYAKEDGSDGVVRVAASNLNFNYVRFEPTDEARVLSWREAGDQVRRNIERTRSRRQLYRIVRHSRPGVGRRPVVPFAIPFACAHSGDEMGIVTGSAPREQVLKLLDLALTTTRGNWPGRTTMFEAETRLSYEQALARVAPKWWAKWLENPIAQYDPHAQVIVRLRDQDGRPVRHYDVFFDSVAGRTDPSLPIRELMEHRHVNGLSPNIITFYLRTGAAAADTARWGEQVNKVDGCFLEITATEPQTDDVLYVPFRYEFSARELSNYLVPHATTVLDIELLRLPSEAVFRMATF